MELLLTYNVDIDAKDNEGKTARDWAVEGRMIYFPNRNYLNIYEDERFFLYSKRSTGDCRFD